MKIIQLLLSLLFLSVVVQAQEPVEIPDEVMDPSISEESEIFKVVEQMPVFPEGVEAMLEFIYKELRYPKRALEHGVEGVVVISFVVEHDGRVSDPTVLRDPGAGCGEEALRIVKAMPLWIPGKQRGRPVRVSYNLPIRFKLPVEPMSEEVEEETVILSPSLEVPSTELGPEVKEVPSEEPERIDEIHIYQMVDEMPHFPEGQEAMMDFIYSNLEYPKLAQRNNIEGLVVISFVVREQGELTDMQIRRDIGGGCGKAALDLVRKMPNWIPGKENGQVVRVSYNLPIRFKLIDKKKRK